MNNKRIEKFLDCIFILGISKKFDHDYETVKEIFERAEFNAVDRFQLINIYETAFHTSGKIENITSFDSSATNCSFCPAMRKAAETCPAHICNFCYDFAQEKYKLNSLNRHSLNMLIMSNIEFSFDELKRVRAGFINRINSAGDGPNKTYYRNMIKISMINNNVSFAFWTKNKVALIAATDELGKPENAIYIQSSKIIGRPEALAKYFDYCFTVYPDKESTENAIKNGASACNGKKCMDCNYKCYFGTHGSVNIAECLRGASKEKIAIIKEWLANN